MCQMRVVMEMEGKEELLLENVTSIDVLKNAVSVTTLFEGSREIAGTVRRMDFLSGKVFLAPV